MSILRKTILLGKDLKKIAFKRTEKNSNESGKKTFRSYDIERPDRHANERSTILHPSTMNVVDVVQETNDAISLVMTRQDGKPVNFVPGMFFTVIVSIEGVEHRRAYSISSSSLENQTVAITIKRIENGLVSSWIHENIFPGSSLRVLGPSGQFTVRPVADHQRFLLLVAGGSGVTPIMSIAKSLLATESQSQIYLLYGNRSVDDVIFRDELARLQHQFQDRFIVRHILEVSPTENFEAGAGRLDRTTFQKELKDILKQVPLTSLDFYVCGPEPMMEGVNLALKEQGVAEGRIHQERFTPAPHRAIDRQYQTQAITIHANGKTLRGVVKPGETLLEAGLSLSSDMVFSCVMGGCGRCRVKLLSGEVDMEEPNCLTPDERNQRYALACVSHPLTPVEIVVATPSTPL